MTDKTPDEIEREEHEQLQREQSTPSIGGSTAAVIAMEALGLKPPYGLSSFGKWLQMKKLAPQKRDTDRFEMGRLMEEPISIRFQRKTGIPLTKVPELKHPSYSWVTGHIDRGALAEPVDVELKTVEWNDGLDWSAADDPDQRVPPLYFFQVVWYAGIPRYMPGNPALELGAFERDIYIAAQFGFSKPLRIYQWSREDPSIRQIWLRMFEACQFFWEEYVIEDAPPPKPSDPGAAKEWLKVKFPPGSNSEEYLDASKATIEAAYAYKHAAKMETHWKSRKESLGADLAAAIGSAYGIRGVDGKRAATVTWPSVASQVGTDWEAVVRELAVDVPADLIGRHTNVVRNAYRRLNVNIRKAADDGEENE